MQLTNMQLVEHESLETFVVAGRFRAAHQRCALRDRVVVKRMFVDLSNVSNEVANQVKKLADDDRGVRVSAADGYSR
jgi:hypothetical protein